jgi:hypothetical protein
MPDFLKDPMLIGGVSLLAALLLILLWLKAPIGSGGDVQRYQELKKLLSDVRAKREQKSTDFSAEVARAEKLTAEYASKLKEATGDYPAKLNLLYASRDYLPKMMGGDLSHESPSEKDFAELLNQTATILKVQ